MKKKITPSVTTQLATLSKAQDEALTAMQGASDILEEASTTFYEACEAFYEAAHAFSQALKALDAENNA